MDDCRLTMWKYYVNGIFVNMPLRFMDKYEKEIFSSGIYLEIGINASELDVVPLGEFEKLATRLFENRIFYTLHGPFWELCPGSEDCLIRQITYSRFQQFLDVAQVMNPIHVVLHTGYDPRHHRYQQDLWLDRAARIWEPLLNRAEVIGIKILLENVWEESPDFHKRIFEKMKCSSIGFCLDLGHQNCFSNSPLSVWLEELHSYIGEIHIHDNDGTEDSHSPPSSGTVDFRYLFDFLNRKQIFPVLNVEPHTEEDFVKTFKSLKTIMPFDFFDKYRKALAQKKVRS